MLMAPWDWEIHELDYDTVVGKDTVVTPTYDPHCGTDGQVSGGCEPVAVISAEKLRDYTEGPEETARIANALHNDERTGDYVIAPEAWDCIWGEIIQKGYGGRTVYDRPGSEEGYNFSSEMLQAMMDELTRLVTKYDGPDWKSTATANRVVELVTEHRALIQIELNEVNTGVRKLGDKDFLGPKERKHRRELRIQQGESVEEQKDYSAYFRKMEEKVHANKRRDMRRTARKEERVSERMA